MRVHSHKFMSFPGQIQIDRSSQSNGQRGVSSVICEVLCAPHVTVVGKRQRVSAIVGGLTCVRFVRPTHSASRPVCMAGLLSVFLADVSTSLVSIVSTILLLDLVSPPLFPRNDWRTWDEPTSRNTLIALVSLEIVHHLCILKIGSFVRASSTHRGLGRDAESLSQYFHLLQ